MICEDCGNEIIMTDRRKLGYCKYPNKCTSCGRKAGAQNQPPGGNKNNPHKHKCAYPGCDNLVPYKQRKYCEEHDGKVIGAQNANKVILERYGNEHYSKMAKNQSIEVKRKGNRNQPIEAKSKGGNAVLKEYGREYFVKMGESNRGKPHSYKHILAVMKACAITPNKVETQMNQILDNLFPNTWKFVGDGQFVLAGKCPDFIRIDNKKQIIEVFGDYWHEGENIQDRVKIFEPYGYQTLIIWEHELDFRTSSKEELVNKLISFMEG